MLLLPRAAWRVACRASARSGFFLGAAVFLVYLHLRLGSKHFAFHACRCHLPPRFRSAGARRLRKAQTAGSGGKIFSSLPAVWVAVNVFAFHWPFGRTPAADSA